jgi:hypothetical protein
MLKKYTAAIVIIAGLIGLTACDPEHKKKCEWYLMPNPDAKTKVEEGYIPVCARNLIINKEDCRLQAKLDYSKKIYGQKFKYSDLKVDEGRYPKKVLSIKKCD